MLLLCLTCWTVSRCDKKYELTLNILNWVSRSLLLAQLIDNMTSCCTILEKPGSYLQTSRNYSPEYITPWILPLSVYSIIYQPLPVLFPDNMTKASVSAGFQPLFTSHHRKLQLEKYFFPNQRPDQTHLFLCLLALLLWKNLHSLSSNEPLITSCQR